MRPIGVSNRSGGRACKQSQRRAASPSSAGQYPFVHIEAGVKEQCSWGCSTAQSRKCSHSKHPRRARAVGCWPCSKAPFTPSRANQCCVAVELVVQSNSNDLQDPSQSSLVCLSVHAGQGWEGGSVCVCAGKTEEAKEVTVLMQERGEWCSVETVTSQKLAFRSTN